MNAVQTSSEILSSWKEIAAYLNRGVRTVQRWEAELGLPVRRPRSRNRSAVIAFRSELDQWVKACALMNGGSGFALPSPPPAPECFDLGVPATHG